MKEDEVKGFQFSYGIVMLRTKRFTGLMDSLGRRRISRPAGWALLFLMPIGAALALFIFLSELSVLLSPAGQAAITYVRTLSPLGNLGIPGINPYLPVVYGWIALYIAIIVHEGAHGIIARSLGLRVKSAGLIFLFFFPLGAFVEVDENELRAARARDSERVLGAGAGINLVVGLISLLLLLSVVSSMAPAVSGIAVASVYSNSPAANAGIKPGDFITAVNGVHISDPQQIANSSWYVPGGVINVTTWRPGETIQYYGIRLANVTEQNTQTNTTYQRAFLGVNELSTAELQSTVNTYTSSFFKTPLLYIACIPTLPLCQNRVPFSDSMAPFYTSSLGGSYLIFTNLLYWVFFLNFNLAIFNSLPIYPLDGGQAFNLGVKALSKGRLSDEGSLRLTTFLTLALIAMLFLVIAGPYIL